MRTTCKPLCLHTLRLVSGAQGVRHLCDKFPTRLSADRDAKHAPAVFEAGPSAAPPPAQVRMAAAAPC